MPISFHWIFKTFKKICLTILCQLSLWRFQGRHSLWDPRGVLAGVPPLFGVQPRMHLHKYSIGLLWLRSPFLTGGHCWQCLRAWQPWKQRPFKIFCKSLTWNHIPPRRSSLPWIYCLTLFLSIFYVKRGLTTPNFRQIWPSSQYAYKGNHISIKVVIL